MASRVWAPCSGGWVASKSVRISKKKSCWCLCRTFFVFHWANPTSSGTLVVLSVRTVNYIYKSISRNENNYVRYESQHITKQALVKILHVLYTYSTKNMQSITYSGIRVFNTIPVNIRRCQSFVTMKCRLKAHIFSNNGGYFAIFLRY